MFITKCQNKHLEEVKFPAWIFNSLLTLLEGGKPFKKFKVLGTQKSRVH